MKTKNLSWLYVAVFFTSVLSAQPAITDRSQLWLAYANQTKLNKHWGYWVELHQRNISWQQPNVTFFRPGCSFFVTNDLRLTAGYGLFYFNTSLPDLKADRWEHRFWQQVWYRYKFNEASCIQYLRLEQRYLQKVSPAGDATSDFVNSSRVRYSIQYLIPLPGRKLENRQWFVSLQNEFMINLNERFTYNTFDQNRLFAGLGYYLSPNLQIHAGYLNVFQTRASAGSYYNNHCFRMFLVHNLNFSK